MPKEEKKQYPTNREWQVIWRLAWGYKYEEVGEALGFEWKTAYQHSMNASKKVGDGYGSHKSQVVRWFLTNFPKSTDPWKIDAEIKRARSKKSVKNSGV